MRAAKEDGGPTNTTRTIPSREKKLTAYPTLFSPTEVGGVTLRNRIAFASILTHYFHNNQPTEKVLNYYRSRAQGGAGMIVTEPLAMTSHNRSSYKLRVWDEEGFDNLKAVADVVRNEGCHLLGQVQDSGRGRHEVGRNDGAVGPSALPDDLSWTVPRVLDANGIRSMIDEWAEASN